VLLKEKSFKWLTFFRQVRAEASQVTWPTRQEVISFVIMVVLMVIVFSIFFFCVDSIVAMLIYWLVH